jgi:nicotinic acid mononucleotide adenylyltransferase
MSSLRTFYFSPRALHRFARIQEVLDQLNPDAEPQAHIVLGSPVPRGTIIVFPGSFNPPTTAHLALLKQAHQFVERYPEAAKKERQSIIYASFSKRTIDKEHVERPLLLDRVVLLDELLRHRLPGTGIVLFNRGLYVEQAKAIHKTFPRVKRLIFLLGFDKIVQILDPHYYADRDTALHELFALAELLVAPRGAEGAQELAELLKRSENRPFAEFIHPLPFNPAYRDVSSTHIRQCMEVHLRDIPHEVQRFIRKTRAYASPLHLPDGTEVDIYEERVKALQRLMRNVKSER